MALQPQVSPGSKLGGAALTHSHPTGFQAFPGLSSREFCSWPWVKSIWETEEQHQSWPSPLLPDGTIVIPRIPVLGCASTGSPAETCTECGKASPSGREHFTSGWGTGAPLDQEKHGECVQSGGKCGECFQNSSPHDQSSSSVNPEALSSCCQALSGHTTLAPDTKVPKEAGTVGSGVFKPLLELFQGNSVSAVCRTRRLEGRGGSHRASEQGLCLRGLEIGSSYPALRSSWARNFL